MKAATKAFIEVKGLRLAMSSRQDELHQKDVTIAFLQRSLDELRKTDTDNQVVIKQLKAAIVLEQTKTFKAETRMFNLEYQLKNTKTSFRVSLPVGLLISFGGGSALGYYLGKR